MLNIKNLRMAAGMSQTELAREIGVCPQLICMIENGHRKPTVKVAQKLAPILAVKWYELIDESKPA